MKHTDVHDAVLLSPYRGGALAVHMLLLNLADDDGICWPSVTWLVQHSHMTDRNVRKILAQMRADGILVQVGTTASGVVRYKVCTPVTSDRGTPVISDRGACHQRQGETQRNTESETQKPTSRPRRDGEEKDMPVIGAMDDEVPEPPKKKRAPEEPPALGTLPPDEPELLEVPLVQRRSRMKRGTHAWCFNLFVRRASEHRHPQVNEKHLHRVIRLMGDRHDLDYMTIEKIIESFFLKHTDKIRTCDSPVALFNGLLGSLIRDTAPYSPDNAVARNALLRPTLIGEEQ